mmetsp:Transcript_11980/g.18387  ORF Transcript_11980/g.18387 Transcript_11980/m.18387 type:complete len:291 (-) Transcript_11980:1522-2394(-)|eukprot:CAMPEP_0178908476 /NCGR_PEP_ID=MMETSP0786-20121207/7944_1 /TAXON_ID=186022 /ORGANISM="Thalassionema frauenfeldii, Strain CCMP 1798" /LENGTH=290 /DNA_ID=CAMNT_0020580383 /DNA_START=91 /DNA_END=963 /DNA_ORIENTATION=-
MVATSRSSSSSQAAETPSGKDDNVVRMKDTMVCLPIVYGSVAFFLGKKADEYHTHKWTLYVRGPNNEDLSLCIEKVIFQLHPSFTQPVRELTEPPFEVTERGWGEFEAQIRIVWKDSKEKPTIVNHGIKLYPNSGSSGPPNANSSKEPVLSESYDEVVFTDPREEFGQQLMQIASSPKISFSDSAVQECMSKLYNDEEDFQILLEASNFLKCELEKVKKRMQGVLEEMTLVDEQLLQAVRRDTATKSNTTYSVTESAKTKTTSTVSTTKKTSKQGASDQVTHGSKKQKVS